MAARRLPCATCIDERKAQGRKAGQPKPKPTALLPMYTPPPNRPVRTEWAAMHFSSTGLMVTPAASIRGIICAATASARVQIRSDRKHRHAQLIAACDTAIHRYCRKL